MPLRGCLCWLLLQAQLLSPGVLGGSCSAHGVSENQAHPPSRMPWPTDKLEPTVLSPHEFAVLLLVNDGAESDDLDRADVEALIERQLVTLERRGPDHSYARVTLRATFCSRLPDTFAPAAAVRWPRLTRRSFLIAVQQVVAWAQSPGGRVMCLRSIQTETRCSWPKRTRCELGYFQYGGSTYCMFSTRCGGCLRHSAAVLARHATSARQRRTGACPIAALIKRRPLPVP